MTKAINSIDWFDLVTQKWVGTKNQYLIKYCSKLHWVINICI